jgi:hypothetical protein
MRANRDSACDLEGEGEPLKKRLVRMISTIHEETIVNTGQKDQKTSMEIKKPYAVVQ